MSCSSLQALQGLGVPLHIYTVGWHPSVWLSPLPIESVFELSPVPTSMGRQDLTAGRGGEAVAAQVRGQGHAEAWEEQVGLWGTSPWTCSLPGG